MFKRILILLLFISLTSLSFGQFLHFGARGFISPILLMKYYEYDVTDYVYYFSNDRNETIRFSEFEFSTIKSYAPSPDIYISYDLGNHLFFQTDLFYMKFSNKAKFKNSVDYKDFVQEFNPEGKIENLEYNTINLKWKFTGNSLTMGYRLLKAKRLRPYFFAGISTMYLLDFEHITLMETAKSKIDPDLVAPNRHYNDIVFKNLDTFKLITYHYRFGFGFKYHAVSFNFYLTSSMPNTDIDIYAEKYYGENQYDGDITLSERANYESMVSMNFSTSVNLLSFNLTKKHLKY